jgi:hypothetical protein
MYDFAKLVRQEMAVVERELRAEFQAEMDKIWGESADSKEFIGLKGLVDG